MVHAASLAPALPTVTMLQPGMLGGYPMELQQPLPQPQLQLPGQPQPQAFADKVLAVAPPAQPMAMQVGTATCGDQYYVVYAVPVVQYPGAVQQRGLQPEAPQEWPVPAMPPSQVPAQALQVPAMPSSPPMRPVEPPSYWPTVPAYSSQATQALQPADSFALGGQQQADTRFAGWMDQQHVPQRHQDSAQMSEQFGSTRLLEPLLLQEPQPGQRQGAGARRPARGGPQHRRQDNAPATADLARQLLGSAEERNHALATLLQGDLAANLSFEPAGCRVVQDALDVADRRTARELAWRLQGFVSDAMRSPHANYVVQRIIKVLSPSEVPFLAEEMSRAPFDIARHEYGCRICCRLLEHASTEPSTSKLIDALLSDVADLAVHTYGHHVVECALEHGLPHQRALIIEVLGGDLLQFAGNRNAAYVVEKALIYGTEDQRRSLASKLAALSQRELLALAQGQYGSMVVRAALKHSGPAGQKIQDFLLNSATQAHLRGTRHGRRLLEDLARTTGSAAPPRGGRA